MRLLITQLTRFGLVGSVGLVIDVALFNILRTTVLTPETMHEGPLLAKILSTAVAIFVNWLGNRHWVFRHGELQHPGHESLKFVIVSLSGVAIGLGCLFISHYILGFTSLLADNISSNVIGLALGTIFRFWGYRAWVFAKAEKPALAVGNPANASVETLRSTERAIRPTGLTPLHRIQTVSTIEDRAHRDE